MRAAWWKARGNRGNTSGGISEVPSGILRPAGQYNMK